MAWMSVAEAAAVLGVSERTIWRRIKSETIDTKTENGRTLVDIEELDLDHEPGTELSKLGGGQLSPYAAAHLSMRRVEADALSDALTVLSDYRLSFEEQITRSRRAAWLAGTAAILLLLALGAGAWFHADSVAKLEQQHLRTVNELNLAQEKSVNDLKLQHLEQVGEYEARAAQAAGLSQARSEEVQNLRAVEARHQQRLSEAESSRTQLQGVLDGRLAELSSKVDSQDQASEELKSTIIQRFDETQEKVAARQEAIEARDAEIALLQKRLDSAREELEKRESVHRAMREQSDRVTSAVRQSAARSIGEAEGLRIHLAFQQQMIDRMREELEAARADQTIPLDGLRADDVKIREALWNSVFQDADGSSGTDQSSLRKESAWDTMWLPFIKSWFGAWLLGPGQELNGEELAHAQ